MARIRNALGTGVCDVDCDRSSLGMESRMTGCRRWLAIIAHAKARIREALWRCEVESDRSLSIWDTPQLTQMTITFFSTALDCRTVAEEVRCVW